MKNFALNHAGIDFEFRTVNVKKLQLFQVYYGSANAKQRLHMQADINGDFRITRKENCPVEIIQLENVLSDAIRTYGVVN